MTDYIPTGLTLADAAWTDNGDGTATYATDLSIAAGGSATITVSMTVDSYVNDTMNPIVNWAEISDDNGDEGTNGGDVDSTPDADNGEESESPTDGVINEDGTNGGDEDDHDPAILMIGDVYDLALTKVLSTTTPGPFVPGSAVSFDIEVANQGNMPASNVEVTDYMPAEFTLTDSAWTDNGDGTATMLIAGPIAAGTSQTVTISFEINQHILGSVINWAEISNDDGDDVDSAPDADQADDVYNDTDDVTDNTSGDEDDHDPAEIEVDPYYDLALEKNYNGAIPFVRDGEMVTFDLTVYNQGNIYAEDVEVTDYIPTGLVLADAAWTDNGNGTASQVIAAGIPAGDSHELSITFVVDESSGGGILLNYAEISAENGEEFGGDVDSMPDADQ